MKCQIYMKRSCLLSSEDAGQVPYKKVCARNDMKYPEMHRTIMYGTPNLLGAMGLHPFKNTFC